MKIIRDFFLTFLFFTNEALKTFVHLIKQIYNSLNFILQNIIAPLFGSVLADVNLISNILISSFLHYLHFILYSLSKFLYRVAKTCKFNSERIIIKSWEVN